MSGIVVSALILSTSLTGSALVPCGKLRLCCLKRVMHSQPFYASLRSRSTSALEFGSARASRALMRGPSEINGGES
jgi:hypothetical protein